MSEWNVPDLPPEGLAPDGPADDGTAEDEGSSSRERRPTLLGLDRTAFRWIGAVIAVVGLMMTLYGLSIFMNPIPMPQPTGNFQQDSKAADAWFQASSAQGNTFFVFGGGGLMLIGAGLGLVMLGSVRPMYGYLAGEAAPAVEVASEAVARGLEKAGFRTGTGSAVAPTTVVKVKCKACGHLNEESAKFCDECARPL